MQDFCRQQLFDDYGNCATLGKGCLHTLVKGTSMTCRAQGQTAAAPGHVEANLAPCLMSFSWHLIRQRCRHRCPQRCPQGCPQRCPHMYQWVKFLDPHLPIQPKDSSLGRRSHICSTACKHLTCSSLPSRQRPAEKETQRKRIVKRD